MKSHPFAWLKICLVIFLFDMLPLNWAEAVYLSTTPSPSPELNNTYSSGKAFALTSVMSLDTDHDGVQDDNDLDDDNDGILDTAEAAEGHDPLGDADGDGIPNYTDVTNAVGSGDGSSTDYTDNDGNGIPDVYDVDGDGIANHLDLDSDNDGIPDNIEAQTTLGFVVPNADNAATYSANNGLNSAYTTSGGYATNGILPIDTDGNLAENLPDYLDTDSDDQGENDTKEAGFVTASNNSDVDADGLLNDYERGTPNDGYVPNDGITNPSVIFTDSDSDVNFGGDVNYRDAINDAPGIMCGPVSTLYQTVGNNTTGKAEVYRYNPFLQQYLKVGELEGVSNNAATNSAYNAVTQYVYSNTGGGQKLRVYDPSDDFSFVGEITITGTTQNFNNVLFAQDNLLGFINGSKIIKFDISGIASYPATVSVTEIPVTGLFSAAADYALLGDYIYGMAGSNLVKVNVNTGVSTQYSLIFANNTTNNDAAGGTYGAAWQDRFGNFYTFNNTNGDIYKIADVANATIGTAITKILLAAPSGQNDGFGCELNPDPLDWDGDLISDDDDVDDDNDGILDVVEDANLDNDNDPLTNFTDTDGDNIPDGYDLDSDGDGLPDNIEAQTTAGYIAPSGSYDAFGLDLNYAGGLSPVNTDGTFPDADAIPDYLDIDSDNDGTYDMVEANLVLSTKDQDGDGLDNNIDTSIGLDDPNGIINDPSTLPNTGGVGDIDVRDAKDTDGDGILDVMDFDDDNDGIPDTLEATTGYDPLGDADGDGAPNFSDVSSGVGAGDGSTTDYTDDDSNGIPDVYDVDGDGVANHLDLDSDNDGIYDVLEAGHGQAQTGGRVDGNTGTDGLPDAVQEAGNENSGTINYSLIDTESDNTPDFLETDADSDGCDDVREAGFTDNDQNGFLGSGTFGAGMMVNAHGLVTSGSDGYTTPNAEYTDNSIKVACNRPPTAANKTLTTNEDVAVTISTADLGYSDPDGDVLSKITINTIPAEGTLFLDADGDNQVDTGEALAADEEATKVQLDAGQLKFLPATNGHGVAYASFTFTVNDSFTDAAGANTITFNVTSVNDAPVGSNKTLTTGEDELVTVNTADLGYNDADGDVLVKITVNTIPAAGTLFLDADDNDVIDADEPLAVNDEITKTQLDNGLLKFLPEEDAYGANYASFNFTVNDGTASAIASNTITFEVTAVNDAPTATNKTLTTNEDTPVVVTLADVGFNDIDGDAISKITINQAPASGTLFVDANDDDVIDDGEALSDDEEVTQTQLNNSQLKFLPDADESGVSYAVFDFTVNDGTEDAVSANTITFDVTAVNDAPTAADKTLTTQEDTPVIVATTDLGYQDTENEALSKLILQTIPAAGTLFLDVDDDEVIDTDETVAVSQEVTLVQLDNGLLKFLPEQDAYGAAYASFTFKVHDGTLEAAAANTITFEVTAVNDAAVLDLDLNDDSGATGADYQTSFTEGNTDVSISDDDILISDTDHTQLSSVTIVLTNRPDGAEENLSVNGTLPIGISVSDSYNDSDGQLVLSGTASLSDYQEAILLVVYNNSSEDPTATDRSITVTVNDGVGNSNVASTTLSLTPVNDAPVTNNGVVIIEAEEEGTDYALSLSAPSDVDDADATLVITVTELPSLGTITLSDGTAVTENQVLTIAQLTGLQYDAPADYDGVADPGDFVYSVSDGDETVTQTVAISLEATNDAPVIAVPAAQNTNEDTPLVFNTANSNVISISDADGDGQTVTLTVTKGTFSLSQTTGLTFTEGDGSEDETMSFSGSLSDINAALLGSSFLPASHEYGAASLTLSTEDDHSSDSETIAITITAVNDAPTATNNLVTSEEDTDYTFLLTDFGYNDIENQDLDHIEITQLPDQGILFIDTDGNGLVDTGETVTLHQDITAADLAKLKFKPEADANGNSYDSFDFLVHDGTEYAAAANTISVDITAVNDVPATNTGTVNLEADEEGTDYALNLPAPSDVDDADASLVITVTQIPTLGKITLADGTAVTENQVLSIAQLTGLQYDAPADYDGVADPGDFVYSVSDGNQSASGTVDISLTTVNDVPSVSVSSNQTTEEDTPLVFNTANSNVISISDADGDGQTVTLTVTNGTFSLSQTTGLTFTEGDGSEDETMRFSGSLSDINAALLGSSFLPAANHHGAASLTLSTEDDHSSDSETIAITITAVNDAPTAADKTLTTQEDTPVIVATADLGYQDTENEPLSKLILQTLPAAGTLFLDVDEDEVIDTEEDLAANDEVTLVQLDAGLLKFLPDQDEFGAAYASFTFKVHDGTLEAAAANTITFEVTAVNDPPTAEDNTVIATENSAYTFSAEDFGFDDVEGSPLDHLTITGLPDEGTLFVDADGDDAVGMGEAVLSNQDIDASDIAKLKFLPEAYEHGVSYTAFTFTVHDGTTYAVENYTITIDVNHVNHLPVAADKTLSTSEDMPVTVATADLGYSDPDGDVMSKIRIDLAPDQGSLFLDGNSNDLPDEGEGISDGSEVTKAQLDAGQLKFLPAGNEYGTGYASIDFTVHDGITYALSTYSITFDVNAVNDAPTSSDKTLDTAEDTDYAFAVTDFHYSDVEHDAFHHISITDLPDQGMLYVDANENGVADDGETVTLNQDIAVAHLSLLKYRPATHKHGADTFDFLVNDGTADAATAATIIFSVESVNDAPVVNDVALSGSVNHAVHFEANDFTDQYQDVENSPLIQIKIISLPTQGTLLLHGHTVEAQDEILIDDIANLTLVPASGYRGLITFDWNGYDGTTYADHPATVEITLSDQQAPVLTDGNKVTQEEKPLLFNQMDFTAAFSDPDGDLLQKIKVILLPEHGRLLLKGDTVKIGDEIPVADLDALSFVPDDHFFGTTGFDWNGYDGTTYALSEATLHIEVTPVDDATPTATTLGFTLDKDASLVGASLINAVTDPEGKGLTFQTTPLVDVAHGSLTLNDDGTFTYVPDAGYEGTDSFTYQVCDKGNPAACITGTVTLQVGSPNQNVDSDQDGIADVIERGDDPENPSDHDADGIPDYLDTDSDNDGIADHLEAGDLTAHNTPADTDGDGLADYLDTDSDNDGIPDALEAGNGPVLADTDQDGIPDVIDTDSDNDGISDTLEAGNNPSQPTDVDGDGIPDFRDTDSDNDGIPDGIEAGTDPLHPIDTDGDGTPDFKESDSDNDGIPDGIEAGQDPNHPVDSDRDGIPDFRETDSDGDGLSDGEEAGDNPSDPADTDGDGIPDFQESDSDGDGIPDGQEDVITIYQGFSPNDDGKNDVWWIEGIEEYPNNSVQIFNRWGNKIYETNSYNNQDRAWGSQSSIGLILGESQVPDGTYFYIIDLGDGSAPRRGYVIVHR